MSMRKAKAALLAAGSIVGASSALGQTAVSFVGVSGGFWHNSANWQPMVVPDNNLGGTPPVSYTVSIDRNVLINGGQFDIAGMTNTGSVDTFTSWDFQAGIGTGTPFLLNTGTVSIVPVINSSAFISVASGNTLTVTGGGTFRLGGAGLGRVLGGGTLINQDNTFRGEGTIGEGVLSLVNNGVIAATQDDLGGAGTLTVFPGDGGLTNGNTLQARAMGNLLLRGFIENTGGTIIADDGGTVHLAASPTIVGGTITTAAGGTVLVASQTARWEGSLYHGGRTIVSAALGVRDTLTNDGSITVSGQLRIDNAATFSGDGTIILQNGTINRLFNDPATWVNRNTIRGTGSIGVNTLTINNSGRIFADTGALSIDPGVNGVFTNTGTLLAINGGTLSLLGNGGSFNNAGGSIHAGLNSRVRLLGTRISGGSLSSSDGAGFGAVVVPVGSTARLTNVDVAARFDVESGGVLEMENNIGTGSGTLTLFGGALLRIVSSATLNLGNVTLRPGAIVRAGTTSFADGPESGVVFYNDSTFRGAGTIGLNDLQIVNNGAFRGDGGGVGMSNPLAFDPSDKGLLNAGIIEAIDLGVVILNGGTGAFTQNGTAVIRATDPGSNVQLVNAFVSGGQLGAGGGSITSLGGGVVTLESLTTDANLVQSGVGTLLINQNVMNTGTISTPGVANLVVAGASTLNSASGFHINQGTISVGGGGFADFDFVDNATTLSSGRILLASNAQARAYSIDQGTLSIANNAFATLKSSFAPGVDGSIVANLNVGSIGAALDVTNRGMAVNYSGGSPLATIRAMIETGYAGGAWTGLGIRSSSAAADGRFAVGYAEASAVGSPATFLGRPIDSSTVLFRFTLEGDADLNGAVNIGDFARLAASFNQAGPWSSGNFNYDAVVSIADFALLAANFNQALPAPSSRPADVPEPMAPLAAAVLLAATTGRRRRRGWAA